MQSPDLALLFWGIALLAVLTIAGLLTIFLILRKFAAETAVRFDEAKLQSARANESAREAAAEFLRAHADSINELHTAIKNSDEKGAIASQAIAQKVSELRASLEEATTL